MRTELATLRRTTLFAGLEDDQLAELAPLLTPWHAPAGAVVLRQGDPGNRLLMVTEGRLGVTLRVGTEPERMIGEVGPGEIAGELSLLVGGPRNASVSAIERTEGVAITSEAFELLRAQLRPVALELLRRVGETALQRLYDRYASLAGDAGDLDAAPAPAGDRGLTAYTGPAADKYLEDILFFRRFAPAEIYAICDGMQLYYGPRRAPLETRGRIWIVVRGAVETLLRTDGTLKRVRLAGPGRCVGHLEMSTTGAPVLPLESRLRERAILLEIPVWSGTALLAGEGHGARRFAEAFHEDVVRALIEVQTYSPDGGLARSEASPAADPALA